MTPPPDPPARRGGPRRGAGPVPPAPNGPAAIGLSSLRLNPHDLDVLLDRPELGIARIDVSFLLFSQGGGEAVGKRHLSDRFDLSGQLGERLVGRDNLERKP